MITFKPRYDGTLREVKYAIETPEAQAAFDSIERILRTNLKMDTSIERAVSEGQRTSTFVPRRNGTGVIADVRVRESLVTGSYRDVDESRLLTVLNDIVRSTNMPYRFDWNWDSKDHR